MRSTGCANGVRGGWEVGVEGRDIEGSSRGFIAVAKVAH